MTARRGSRGKVTISAYAGGKKDKARLKIFEPYFTTRPFAGGTGLGLSIVHGIAHAHGGWVEVAPTYPGARISVFFPCGESRPAQH